MFDLFFLAKQLDTTLRILSLELAPGDDGPEQVTVTVAASEREDQP